MDNSAIRWPNEEEAYRTRREELLREEAALRRQLERVAALRRSLPPGGAVRDDYEFAEGPDGDQWPMLNVFEQRDGQVRHFYGTELLCAPTDPGQDPRHVDLIWPLWNVLDFTREGRGTDWYPALSYES